MNFKQKTGELHVQEIGQIIVARISGDLSASMVMALGQEIKRIAQETGLNRVLINGLEMNPPQIEIPILQWQLNAEQVELKLRRAIVVRDSRMAYLARLAFGEAEHRVFYEDLAGAMSWLNDEPRVSSMTSPSPSNSRVEK